jgi:hypothetical protein
MKSKYIILERKGKFIVGQNVMRKRFLRKPIIEFKVCYIGFNQPAHFTTLEMANAWVKLQEKPDKWHEIE